jgi:uncharacterized protein YjbI with pentapeptide repeats
MKTQIIANMDLISGTYNHVYQLEMNDCSMESKIFSGSLLQENLFTGVTFKNCIFFGCNLKDCCFINCKFINCQFHFTHLKNNCFELCEFEHTSWIQSSTHHSELLNCITDIATEILFKNTYLTNNLSKLSPIISSNKDVQSPSV